MRGLVQRVSEASISIVEQDATVEVGAIGTGLCVLVGVTHDDDRDGADRLADKIWNLRLFDDDDGVMNRSLADLTEAGDDVGVLIVSQFTLYGDTAKGRRPSWTGAARPAQAEPLVDRVVERLRSIGATVATGRFGAAMVLSLTNDGPVTVMVELP